MVEDAGVVVDGVAIMEEEYLRMLVQNWLDSVQLGWYLVVQDIKIQLFELEASNWSF